MQAETREALEGPITASIDSAVSEGVLAPETPADQEPALTKWQRHWLTGDWQEVPIQNQTVFYAGDTPAADGAGRRVLERRNYEREFRPLSIAPEQATPERIAKENAEARRHGTGAVYDKDGRCHTTTRGSQNRELRRKGRINNDAGYNDWAGR